MKRVAWTWIFAVLAVLFNPIAPVHLQRATWQVVDAGAIIVTVLAAATFWYGRDKSPSVSGVEGGRGVKLKTSSNNRAE